MLLLCDADASAATAKDYEVDAGCAPTRTGNACTNVPVIFKLRDQRHADAAHGPVIDVYFQTLEDIKERVAWLLGDSTGDELPG